MYIYAIMETMPPDYHHNGFVYIYTYIYTHIYKYVYICLWYSPMKDYLK